MDTFNQWMILKDEVKACKGCYLTSETKLLDRGNRDARIMIVGDAPTSEDVKANRLFAGTNGKLLDGILKLVDIDPEQVYITSLVNCPSSKAPKPQAIDTCIKCLRKQFQLVKPEIVICLGSIVAKKLISPDFKLSRDHGMLTPKGKVMFMGTYHPASVNYNSGFRHQILGDFIKIQEFCRVYPPFSKQE